MELVRPHSGFARLDFNEGLGRAFHFDGTADILVPSGSDFGAFPISGLNEDGSESAALGFNWNGGLSGYLITSVSDQIVWNIRIWNNGTSVTTAKAQSVQNSSELNHWFPCIEQSGGFAHAFKGAFGKAAIRNAPADFFTTQRIHRF